MKKGFTLIELLAVIVILAIIALIATPIILGIINDAREESNERSVELYASAVRNAIAAYQLTNANAPISFDDLDVQYDGDVVCSTQKLYEDGSFYLEGCKVNNGDKEYRYGTKQEKVVYLKDVCKPESIQTEGVHTAGDKYTCTVDPNKPSYTFYVLTTVTDQKATSVDLIMDQNINSDGTPAGLTGIEKNGDNVYNLIEWISVDDYGTLHPDEEGICDAEENGEIGCVLTDKGPITVMNFLQEATKTWTNTNELLINSFTYCDYEENCTDKPMTEYVVNARLSHYSEVRDLNGTKAYLLGNIDYNKNVGAYWTFSTYLGYPRDASVFEVTSSGINTNYGNCTEPNGVRPVINLSI